MAGSHAVVGMVVLKVHQGTGAFGCHVKLAGAQSDVDAFTGQDVEYGGGHVGILTAHQLAAMLEHGDLCAEAPVHLGKLKGNITAANDDQMLG